MTPLDLAKRECLRECGQLDYRYCAEWLNAYSMECLRRLTAGTAGRTVPSPDGASLNSPGSEKGRGPFSGVDPRELHEWIDKASCYDAGSE